jgi:hypothetical protein
MYDQSQDVRPEPGSTTGAMYNQSREVRLESGYTTRDVMCDRSQDA